MSSAANKKICVIPAKHLTMKSTEITQLVNTQRILHILYPSVMRPSDTHVLGSPLYIVCSLFLVPENHKTAILNAIDYINKTTCRTGPKWVEATDTTSHYAKFILDSGYETCRKGHVEELFC